MRQAGTTSATFGALCVALTMGSQAAAGDTANAQSRQTLDKATRILGDLQGTRALQHYLSESLLVECAVLRYRDHPKETLVATRVIKEPFYASLALRGISALRLENDPDEAKNLLLEAQDRALKIDHWTGSDATSLAVAQALQEASRTEDALALLDEVDARVTAKVTQASRVRDLSRRFRTLWTAEEVRAVSAEAIDRFLKQPELSELIAMVYHNRPIVFRDGKQAASFVAATWPLAGNVKEFGYPHHGSPRSVLLGMLAKIRAVQGDLGQAEKVVEEIAVPELKAFYLMEACEVSRPLPGVLRGWPIYFYTRTEIQIGA
jgi:hypothetical protein